MTIAIEVLGLVLMVFCLALDCFLGYDVVSSYIKKHRYDCFFNPEPYDVKDAKHFFCELYKNVSEYEVFESVDSNVFAVIRKEFIEKDFDKPVDDDDEDDNADTPAS